VNPPLFVVKGDASPEEVAALVVVLQALASAGATRSSQPPPRPEWSAPRRLMAGATPRPGPGAWRASSLPR
jgi:Acyl-CoA carboxylase epsilon subunit